MKSKEIFYYNDINGDKKEICVEFDSRGFDKMNTPKCREAVLEYLIDRNLIVNGETYREKFDISSIYDDKGSYGIQRIPRFRWYSMMEKLGFSEKLGSTDLSTSFKISSHDGIILFATVIENNHGSDYAQSLNIHYRTVDGTFGNYIGNVEHFYYQIHKLLLNKMLAKEYNI